MTSAADEHFQRWRDALAPVCVDDDEVHASLYNFLAEQRVPDASSEARDWVSRAFSASPGGPAESAQEAKAVLDRFRCDLSDKGNGLLGRIRTAASTQELPAEVVTFVTANDVAQYLVDGPFDLDNPPRRLRLDRYPQIIDTGDGRREPRRRWIWVTASKADQLKTPSRDLCCALGLAHVAPDDYLFRISVDVEVRGLMVPSCFDAALNPAWAVPPGHSLRWGMTRHLETGEPRWIELLVETADLPPHRPVAERVLGPDPSRVDRVGVIRPNYRAGREVLP